VRILQIIQKDQPRGAEIFASQLSRHLRDRGHQVRIVSLFRHHPIKSSDLNHVALLRPLILRFFDFKGWWLLSREIKHFKPDIVQANAGDTLKFAVFSRLFFFWRNVLVYRNANLMSNFAPSGIKNSFNSWLLRQTDYCISVSNLCAQDLLLRFNVPARKNTTIEIGIDERPIPILPEPIRTFISGDPVLVHIGSFVPEKNHAGLIRIFSSIHDKNPEVKLVLVGEGPLLFSIKNQVAETGLSESILFAGIMEDPYPLLSAANVLLLPSLTEGIPAVILEAMYCACPVVAYRVGGIPDLIVQGETGYLVDQGNEQRMVDYAIQILDPAYQPQIEKIKKNASALVQDHYRNAQIAQRFEQTYTQLTSQTL